MSTTYKTIQSDTFQTIAQKNYGTQTHATLIAQANPGASEPLAIGTILNIPSPQDIPKDTQQQTPAANQDEVAILIDGKRFRFWSQVRIVRSIDTIDNFEFTAPFDHQALQFKTTFRPFTYKPVAVTLGGAPLFTGTIVHVNPLIQTAAKTIHISAYSKPGVLNDCTPPVSTPPLELEFDNLPIKEIAAKLAAPFGIEIDYQADQVPPFQRVAIQPTKKILAFLIQLAKQRNLVISSSPAGALLITQPIQDTPPVANLQQGKSPLLSVVPFLSPQEYYSHITGIEPVIVGFSGSKYTVKNPHLAQTLRPHAFTIPDTLDADLKKAVETKKARMFANIAAYTVNLSTWRDPQGKLWQPNTNLTLHAPDAMIYQPYTFTIRSVTFERNPTSQTAVLNLVIPGTLSAKIPEALPWDE